MKIYLELKDDKSEKFWEIEQTGNSHTVRYGKVGAKGTSKTKEFESAEKAEADANKLIKAKQKKGYEETQSPEEIKAAQMPKPQVISFDELKKLHEIELNDNNISHVLYYDEDLELTEDLTQNWAVLEALNLTDKNLLIYINGNLSVDGNISFNTTYPCLYVNGNTKCQELINSNATIDITGDANIRYILHGIGDSGYITIKGTTYVPYLLNNNHHIDFTKERWTTTICYVGNDKLMRYDIVEANFPRMMKKNVMQEDKLQLDEFTKLIRKGGYPFKKTDETDEDKVQKKLLDLFFEPEPVTVLNLSNEGLTSFPTIICQLKDLKVLNLNRNYKLRYIPEEISNLQHLEELHLDSFKGWELPSSITSLSKLKVLDIEGSDVNLPEDIDKLTNLEQLYCKFNPNHFPEGIKNLQNLTKLIVNNLGQALENRTLTEFPEQIFQLKKLTHLHLYHLHFSNFPEGFNQLTNLEELRCCESFTTVQKIPPLTELKKLKVVRIGGAFGNPECIKTFFNIPTITHLGIDRYKKLEPKHLEGINKLTQLKNLTISFSKITNLPEDIYKLKHLSAIDAEWTELNYETLSKLTQTYPNLSLIFRHVEHPDPVAKKEFKRLCDVERKYRSIRQSLHYSSKMEDLNQLFEISDYFYNELMPIDRTEYEYFTVIGHLQKALTIDMGNNLAWYTSQLETDPDRIEKAIKYAERAIAKISPTNDDNIRDSYIRILLKAGRTDDAYEIVHEILSRKPNFGDLKDLKKNKAYLSWVKENK